MWPQCTGTIVNRVGDFSIIEFGPTEPSPWLSYIASGNWWELEAQTIRIDGGAIEEEIRIVWGVLKRWLVFTLLRLQRR